MHVSQVFEALTSCSFLACVTMLKAQLAPGMTPAIRCLPDMRTLLCCSA